MIMTSQQAISEQQQLQNNSSTKDKQLDQSATSASGKIASER